MSYAIHLGDVLDRLRDMPSESVHCVVTSPPYWGLRDYGLPPSTWPDGWVGCLGLEPTPEMFLTHMVSVFEEVRRVLRKDGTCWVNMGDSYANDGKWGGSTGGKHVSALHGETGIGRLKVSTGLKPKDLVGMPWMLAFALRSAGWWLRQDIIWAKPNPMPESVTDRCTKAHEYVFLLTKSSKYFYDAEAIKEPANGWNDSRFDDGKNIVIHPNTGKKRAHSPGSRGKDNLGPKTSQAGLGIKNNSSFTAALTSLPSTRNKRDVWEIATEPFPEAHFATFPTKLVEPCVLAGTSEKGCCGACGAPWVRVMEKYDTGQVQKMADGWDTGEGGHGTVHREGRQAGQAGQAVLGSRTTGWEPTCKCGESAIPCTVLDIFNGSGTTGVVAKRLGRNYLGIELNPEYREIALRRIHADNPMFNVRSA